MARAVDKAPQAFRTITEVSADIGIPPHVLRFWETKFTQLRPMTRPGGRRFYRTEDVALLKGLKGLLHEDGYTIKGVQKIFKEEGIAFVRNRGTQGPPEHAHIRTPLDQRDDGPLFAQLKRAVANDPGISVRLQQTLARLENARAKVKAVMAR